jgi:23S rRNA pseudouridine1911/1915/1917 synthase
MGSIIKTPYLVSQTEDFAVVYKPPQMHCARQTAQDVNGGTLLDWYAEIFPPVLSLAGRKKKEGGLLHRLDFETRGLVLFAKNQSSLDELLRQQEAGAFVKEYAAVCTQSTALPPGFPPPPAVPPGAEQFTIKSFFRPYGPGRKEVRPVTGESAHKEIAKDRGNYYRSDTRALNNNNDNYSRFVVRICRGFRHQIRCHLAWIGFPITGDPLYGPQERACPEAAAGFLGLCAAALFFTCPRTGEKCEYRIEA